MYDVEDDLRAVRRALGKARSNAPELPIAAADPVKAIPDLVTAVEKLSSAVEQIAKFLNYGRPGSSSFNP
jgi:hypothetical protein